MKKSFLPLILFTITAVIAFAQPKQPTILMGPADWGFERMDFPLGFAPGLDFKAYEEIRFAPNWNDTASANYFTYVYVVSIEGQKKFNKAEIKNFLEKYYKGLCVAMGPPNKPKPDTSLIKAEVSDAPAADSSTTSGFVAALPYFDTFTTGRKINLRFEIDCTVKTAANRTYLTVLLSASKDNKTIWDKLHEVKKSILL